MEGYIKEDNPFEYDVCLSFAGENRKYVKRVAAHLYKKEIKVFYDEFEEVNLWGKDLVIHLDEIYRKKAKYCVVFISKEYAQRVWPNQELKSALARAIENAQEYILPARFDQTELPGLRNTIKYIDLVEKQPEELGELIEKKLNKSTELVINIPTDFAGEYIVNNNPTNKLTIKNVTENQFRLERPNVWDGVGIYDGQIYFGVFKYKDSYHDDTFVGVWGTHQAIRQIDGSFIVKGLNKIGMGGEFSNTWRKEE